MCSWRSKKSDNKIVIEYFFLKHSIYSCDIITTSGVVKEFFHVRESIPFSFTIKTFSRVIDYLSASRKVRFRFLILIMVNVYFRSLILPTVILNVA